MEGDYDPYEADATVGELWTQLESIRGGQKGRRPISRTPLTRGLKIGIAVAAIVVAMGVAAAAVLFSHSFSYTAPIAKVSSTCAADRRFGGDRLRDVFGLQSDSPCRHLGYLPHRHGCHARRDMRSNDEQRERARGPCAGRGFADDIVKRRKPPAESQLRLLHGYGRASPELHDGRAVVPVGTPCRDRGSAVTSARCAP